MKDDGLGGKHRKRPGTLLIYGCVMVAMGVGLLAEGMLRSERQDDLPRTPSEWIQRVKWWKAQMLSGCALVVAGMLAIAWTGERGRWRIPPRKRGTPAEGPPTPPSPGPPGR